MSTLRGLPNSLITNTGQANTAVSTSVALDPRIQALIDEVKPRLGLAEGDDKMLIADQPVMQTSSPSTVTLVQTGATRSANDSSHVFGICSLVNLDDEGDGNVSLNPVNHANGYFQSQNLDARVTLDPGGFSLEGVTVRVIQPPQHGKLMTIKQGDFTTEIAETSDWLTTQYLPDNHYRGNDSLILQVEGNGQSVQLHYFFRMDDKGEVGSISENPACKDYL